MVAFASTCDKCLTRSPEYSRWATCRECDEDICDGCAARGSLREAELDTPATCLCKPCAAELATRCDCGKRRQPYDTQCVSCREDAAQATKVEVA
jgi:hypothetical protein